MTAATNHIPPSHPRSDPKLRVLSGRLLSESDAALEFDIDIETENYFAISFTCTIGDFEVTEIQQINFVLFFFF